MKLPQYPAVFDHEYAESALPTERERAKIDAAMKYLERTHLWVISGSSSASFNEGLLMLGYTPTYFDRLGASVEGLTPSEAVLEAVGEDPAIADDHDALLVLDSDYGSILHSCEEALFGNREENNGRTIEGTFEDIFERRERRFGNVGRGHPAHVIDNDSIPEETPLSIGFRSGFRDNRALEAKFTINDGPFDRGRIMTASRLHIELDRWYEQDEEERIAEIFSPSHNDHVGETADHRGANSEITKVTAEGISGIAEEYNRLGHYRKVARAHDEKFRARILRRSEGIATDVAEGVEFDFHSVQATTDAFVDARKEMCIDKYGVNVPDENQGIVDFLETNSRGSYSVSPCELRALPTI